jgi:hypothetical protein
MTHFSCDQFLISPQYHNRPVHPLAHGISSSPCKCRPDTGVECPLMDMPKSNDICESCGLLPIGKQHFTAQQIWERLMSGTIEFRATPDTHTCAMPGCENEVFGKYCHKCQQMRLSRRAIWKREYGDHSEPTEAFLNQKKLQRGKAYFKVRRSAPARVRTQAKTVQGSPCAVCGATLRYESNKGCVACALDRSKRKHAEKQL